MRRQAGFFDVKRLSDLGDQLEEIIRKGDIRHLAKAFLLQRLDTQSTGREYTGSSSTMSYRARTRRKLDTA
jgi:hypothetical protein